MTAHGIQRDRRLHEFASRRHGIVRHDQLRSMGFTDDAIARAVTHGHLVRIYPRTYAVGHTHLATPARWIAATDRAGYGSAISHLTAAVGWEMSRFTANSIDVSTPRHVRRTPGLALHRSITLPAEHVTNLDSVPITTRARTIVDLGAVLTGPQLANVMYRAAYEVPAIAHDVRAVLSVMPRFVGRATTLRALAMHEAGSSGTRSLLEDLFLELLQRARIRLGEINVKVGPDELDFEVDHIWRSALLVVEIDGVGHGRERARRIDAKRRAALESHGYLLLRFTQHDVRARGAWCIAQVRAALDGRRARQRRAGYLAKG